MPCVMCRNVLERINLVYITLFTLEAVIKLLAYGKRYWSNSWNIFDFTVVALSWIGQIIQLVLPQLRTGPILSVLRMLRVIRVLRIVKHAKALRVMFNTLLISMPAILNVTLLLGLFLFIYAVIGMQMFATVMWQLWDQTDANINFQSFGLSMVTMYRATTGEAWDYTMTDIGSSTAGCDPVCVCLSLEC